MKLSIKERIGKLRTLMKERGISIYIVPTSDFHESEYVGDYFKARKFITGFTGSAGTAVITEQEAGLWTDGRYFIQAAGQLQGSGVTLYKMGEEGVPTVKKYVENSLKEGGCIGFDGRVVNAKDGGEYEAIAEKKKGSIFAKEDLIGLIWEDRPAFSKEPVWVLEEKYSGKHIKDKLAAVRKKMEETGAKLHILTSLYDIAWLLNVRGGDINHVPVVLSFLALTKEECIWFLHEEIVADEVKAYLSGNGVRLRPYEEIYDFASSVSKDTVVLINKKQVNYRIVSSISCGTKILDQENPTELMKAVKNDTELENTRLAHIKDGAAVTKFMYWLKTNIGSLPMTELSASAYLESKRREQENFLDLSFDTICAYGPNGAMMHYAATEESNAVLKPEGFLLVDSGGHYLEGTTDVTRTFALGPVTDTMKQHFTAVCISNLNLAGAKFLYGCRGLNLDILSREPLWELGIDYKCGTGHGVGHILNVHEGPNSFRWQIRDGLSDHAVLEEGMITTDEPGVYLEGEYGIRTENELICQKAEKNEWGQFMAFENITCVPIDLDAIDTQMMSEKEKKRLNDYHKKVYEAISPYMTKEEDAWLKKYTRAI